VAKVNYERFLILWNDADSDVPVLKQAKGGICQAAIGASQASGSKNLNYASHNFCPIFWFVLFAWTCAAYAQPRGPRFETAGRFSDQLMHATAFSYNRRCCSDRLTY
jgi:hypothetical protein